MTDFKEGGVPTPDYDTDDINFISQKTEFTDDVFVYGKLYADLGGDVQSFSTAGVERIRITKDGKIGIGIDNPNTKVHMSGANGSDNALRIDTSGNAITIHNHSEFIGFIGNDSGKLFINAGGTEDILLLKTNGQNRIKISKDGLVKGTLHTLIGEHNGATSVGELFSFGNGSTDNHGPAMPFAGKVMVVTISKSGGSNAGIFQPSKNGVTQGGASDQITTTTGSGSVTKNNADFSSLMDFDAGDRINYVTVDATDTSTCLTMLVRFNPV